MKYWIVLVVIIVLAFAGVFMWQGQKMQQEQSQNGAEFTFGEYGYRCGDGTEFTMKPANDMSRIMLIPATSVERIPQATLLKVESTTTAQYTGQGITFTAHGETVQLKTSEFETTCHPMQVPAEAPFNFGD